MNNGSFWLLGVPPTGIIVIHRSGSHCNRHECYDLTAMIMLLRIRSTYDASKQDVR